MSEAEKNSSAKPETAGKTPKSRTKRILSAVLIALLAVIVIAVIIVGFFLNHTIKTTVTGVAPYFTGTPVTLEKVDVSLLHGRVEIGGFSVGNPSGYSNPNAIELQKFVLDLDLGKLLSDPLVVEEVTIEGVTVDYEPNLKMGSNLQDIQANVEKATGISKSADTSAEPAPAKEKSAAQKQVLLKKVDINGITLKTVGGVALPMPPISLTDFGGGKPLGETISEFFTILLSSVTNVVSSESLNNVGKSLKDAGNDVGKSLKDAGENVGKSLKSLFGN